MNSDRMDCRLNRAARLCSRVFHPWLLPCYLLLFMLGSPTLYALYPLRVKIYLVWVVLLFATIVPLLVAALLRSYTLKKGTELLTPRRVESLRMMSLALCYLLCAVAILRIPAAGLIGRMLYAAAICTVAGWIITRFWRISLRTLAMGAAVGLLLLLYFASEGRAMGALIVALLAAGAVGSARLQLGAHTLGEVGAGFALGVLLSVVTVLYIG